MIRSFRCRATARLHGGERVPELPPGIQSIALRKLQQLDLAVTLSDLRFPPGNRLHALQGNRQGQHSIRVNDQYRICFRWPPLGPIEVEITDYH